jgi:hypothetical protein
VPNITPHSAVALFNSRLKHVDGFLNRKQALIWGFLLGLQDESGVGGDIVEIGVYKGRSAALLAAASAPEATIHLVDPHKAEEIDELLTEVATGLAVKYWQCSSEAAEVGAELKRLEGAVRFFHIDGRHNAAFVRRELGLASQAIGAKGLICVDDFFSDRYPEVTLGAFDFLRENQASLALVFCAFNKCYICRRDDHEFYLNAIGPALMPVMRELGFSEFTLFRSNDPEGFNCFSIGKRYQDSDTWGPDGSQ